MKRLIIALLALWPALAWAQNNGGFVYPPPAAGLNVSNTWTASQSYSASILGNITVNSYLSTNLGPSGLGWGPYDGNSTNNYFRYAPPGPHSGIIESAVAIINNTPGSGTFGPASADVALSVYGMKNNYLTNLTTGEIDTVECAAYQGAAGDTGCYIADAVKVRGSGSDSGGVLGSEFHATWVNTSGTPTWLTVSLEGFGEGAGGVSNGLGYGSYQEQRLGPAYSANHVDTLNQFSGAAGTYGWKYAIDATHDRTLADTYFAVRGDIVTGNQVPGDIIQGISGDQTIVRTDSSGIWHLRNTGDTADLISVAQAGAGLMAINAPSPFNFGVLQVREIAGQNLVFVANGNASDSGAAGLASLNDAANAYEPIAYLGSRHHFMIGSVTIDAGLSVGAAGAKLTPQTIAQVLAVTCNSSAEGTLEWVKDTVGSAAPTFHLTLAGSGSTTVDSLVSCNGSNWVYD
jgi:hypothetical protein